MGLRNVPVRNVFKNHDFGECCRIPVEPEVGDRCCIPWSWVWLYFWVPVQMCGCLDPCAYVGCSIRATGANHLRRKREGLGFKNRGTS